MAIESFYEKVVQYISSRPKELFTDRFFIQYQKRKCHEHVIGRNKIDETPQNIATFSKLPDAKMHTGHCFRRSRATLYFE